MSKPVIIQDAECKVYFGEGCLKELPGRAESNRVIILCEKHASAKILPPLLQACPSLQNRKIYRLYATEPAKQIETLLPLWKKWLKDGVDRKTLVINIGGGVLCDMGGFAASTYMRGLPFINIPTTLLSMADASVGGKTAVDLGEVKNILGQFSRPKAVFVDPIFLNTLPEKQILSGIAEILKMQCIANPRLTISGAEGIFTDKAKLSEALRFAIEKKAAITQGDFKEEGPRKKLNFGHTFGHALEAVALKRGRPITHGEAVAHGMVKELRLSTVLVGFPAQKQQQFAELIKKHYGTPEQTAEERAALIQYMRKDKKNADGRIYPVLLRDWGRCVYTTAVSPQQICK